MQIIITVSVLSSFAFSFVAICLQHRASVSWAALCGWAQHNNDREQKKYTLTIKELLLTIKKREIFQMFRKQENNGRKFRFVQKNKLIRFLQNQKEDTELVRTKLPVYPWTLCVRHIA